MFPLRSWCFVDIRVNIFNYLGNKHLAPKAEVTGSNPVGCANIFNNLHPKAICRILLFPDNAMKLFRSRQIAIVDDGGLHHMPVRFTGKAEKTLNYPDRTK